MYVNATFMLALGPICTCRQQVLLFFLFPFFLNTKLLFYVFILTIMAWPTYHITHIICARLQNLLTLKWETNHISSFFYLKLPIKPDPRSCLFHPEPCVMMNSSDAPQPCCDIYIFFSFLWRCCGAANRRTSRTAGTQAGGGCHRAPAASSLLFLHSAAAPLPPQLQQSALPSSFSARSARLNAKSPVKF